MPLHCPRGYISSPPETLRTFAGASTLRQGLHLLAPRSTEDFLLVPLLPQGLHLLAPRSTEDFLLVPLYCPRGYIFSPLETLRTFHSSSPALARRRGGLYLASERAGALRSFNWCLRSPKDDEDFNFNWCFNWCLRSPKDDEDLETF